jgi:glycine dehydrogenase subunit 2
MYFPLIVPECLMIEPTESETQETIDDFVAALKQINAEIDGDLDLVKNAPHTTPVARLDEAQAARRPNLRWTAGS